MGMRVPQCRSILRSGYRVWYQLTVFLDAVFVCLSADGLHRHMSKADDMADQEPSRCEDPSSEDGCNNTTDASGCPDDSNGSLLRETHQEPRTQDATSDDHAHTKSNSSLSCDPLSVLQPTIFFNPEDYILTASGNKIAVNSILCGSHKIHMAGRSIIQPGVVLRGDLAILRIGRYVCIGRGTTLRPAVKTGQGNTPTYIPMTIGDYVTIGDACVITAAAIANGVVIGDNCVVDHCVLLPGGFSKRHLSMPRLGSVLAPDTVVPPFAMFGGAPAKFLEELPESIPIAQRRAAVNLYNRFQCALSY